MDLHPGEEIVFEGHPSWRGVLSFYVKGLGIALAVGLILFFAISTGAGVGAFAAIMVVVILAGLVKRMATRYVISTERLNIRTGILSKHVQQTSIDRVQNVNTEQTFLDRLLRVGAVDFDTAGTDDSEFTFRGVSNPAAIVAAVDRAQRMHRREVQAEQPGGTIGGTGL
ncbi:membrane-flanked domain protein [Baekduia alba]|uniref:PH domain-containing protein n=1 Tax=Baekduia alba TaxID=2997333 RepID=UPI002341AA7C|nr:PH domain-containing protein [Baekduia alba]WCB93684.1 membrane-flanked domain protein [Baekduia alba]